MSKLKSVTVTSIVAVMLGIIVFAAYRLLFPAFVVIVGILSGGGFIAGFKVFCSWLEQESLKEEEAVEPPKVEPPSEWDYEQICDEVNKEAGR